MALFLGTMGLSIFIDNTKQVPLNQEVGQCREVSDGT
jgi:hypothetical protein